MKCLKKAQTEALEENRVVDNTRVKRSLAIKRMVNQYATILAFTRDACDLQLVVSQSEARRLYTVLKEK